MPTFQYVAVNSSGNKITNVINADSPEDAIKKIKDSGFLPRKINEIRSKRKTKNIANYEEEMNNEGKALGTVSSKQLSAFTNQFARLVNANVSIAVSLRILESQMGTCLLKKVLDTIVDDIEGGTSLSDALSRHPEVFGKIYINTVKAGEIAGMLNSILKKLADFLEKKELLKKRITSAWLYPSSAIVLTGGIIMGILMFIIPAFTKKFENMDVAGGIPSTTQAVINASNFMLSNWYYFICVPLMVFMLTIILINTNKTKYMMDRIALKIPLIGKIVNMSAISSFCRTLATLSSAEVPILEGLINTRDATNNQIMKGAINEIYGSVREGGTITEPLRKSGITDEVTLNIISVGEESGELDKMLIDVADNFDAEAEETVKSITNLITPLLLAVLCGAIGFITIAVFISVANMAQNM